MRCAALLSASLPSPTALSAQPACPALAPAPPPSIEAGVHPQRVVRYVDADHAALDPNAAPGVCERRSTR